MILLSCTKVVQKGRELMAVKQVCSFWLMEMDIAHSQAIHEGHTQPCRESKRGQSVDLSELGAAPLWKPGEQHWAAESGNGKVQPWSCGEKLLVRVILHPDFSTGSKYCADQEIFEV